MTEIHGTMWVVNLSGESGTDEVDAIADDPRRVPATGSWVTFTPLVFDGLTWSRITAPQQDARAACLLVTAHIHLFRPEVPLRDLDALAEAAIRKLEDGAATVTVVDDLHRVDRSDHRPAVGNSTSDAAVKPRREEPRSLSGTVSANTGSAPR